MSRGPGVRAMVGVCGSPGEGHGRGLCGGVCCVGVCVRSPRRACVASCRPGGLERSLPSSAAAARISQTSLRIWWTFWSVVGRGYASCGLRPTRLRTLWMAWYPQVRDCCGLGGGGLAACPGPPRLVCGRWGWPKPRARSPWVASGAGSSGSGRAWPIPGGSPPFLR